MSALRLASVSRRAFSTQPPVAEWVTKLNAASRAEDVKDVLAGMKERYPDANVVFRKELPKREPPAPLAPGLIEQYELNKPSRYVPLLGGAFLFLSSNGYWALNEEFMLFYVFCAYTGIAYSKLRGPAMAMLEENNKALLESFNRAENEKINALKASQAEEMEKSSLYTEIGGIPEAKQALKELEAFNAVQRQKEEQRAKVVRSLDALALLQERLTAEQNRELIASANAAVLKEMGADAMKKKMFESALASLKAPKEPVKSPVDDLFKSFFAKTAKAQAGKPTALNAEVKAKMEEVLSTVGLKATDAGMTKFAKA